MDIELYFQERGAGTPLILLHGNGESGDYFQNQLDLFSAHYHVLAPDTRGHGRSPRGASPFTLDQFAEDLGAFLTSRGIFKAHILGFSDGANIALLFALKHPERVEKLVLNGANLSPAGVKRSTHIPILLSYAFACLAARFDKKALAKKERLALMVKEPHIPFSALSTLSMPTLVIAGTRDMIRDSHSRAIAQAIPGARLCLIPGDHFIAEKNSVPFNKAVLDFLKNC